MQKLAEHSFVSRDGCSASVYGGLAIGAVRVRFIVAQI